MAKITLIFWCDTVTLRDFDMTLIAGISSLQSIIVRKGLAHDGNWLLWCRMA
jgi:hypothetical protein